MSLNFETTIHSRIWKPLALLALAVMACAGLAGCGGGGSGGGEEVTIVPQPSPDLVLESPSVSDAGPPAGEPFNLSVTVRNAGDGRAAAVTLRFYRSDDAVVTPSDMEVGVDEVEELAPSESRVASVELAAPSAPGTYHYGACVDTADGESDTANNCSMAVQVTVPGSRPDLVVESPSVSDANPIAGADITLSATVRNDGGAAASATTLRFYRSSDETIETVDEEVGAVEVSELSALGSAAASVSLSAPQAPGLYYYGACADAVEGEFEAADNCSPPVRITVPEAQTPGSEAQTPVLELPTPLLPRRASGPGPDLVAERAGVSETNLVTGQGLRVGAMVRNVGDEGSAATYAGLYRSRDRTITRSDTGMYFKRVWGLAPSDTHYVWKHLTAPSTPGTYYYGACVDAVAGESDTANNCGPASVRVTVRRAPSPDLSVDRPRISPASPAAGGVFTLTVRVRNAGSSGDRAFWLRYFRSDDATFTPSDPYVGYYGVYGLDSLGHFHSDKQLDTPPTGTYYYRVCADVLPGESNTANNCSAPVKVDVTHAKPDLQFYSASVGNWVGNSFPIAVLLRNVGGPSVATTLRFYHSTDEKFTSPGTEVRTLSVPILNEEGRRFNSGWVYVTPPFSPGKHCYRACVDAVAGESDTTNNCSGTIHCVLR